MRFHRALALTLAALYLPLAAALAHSASAGNAENAVSAESAVNAASAVGAASGVSAADAARERMRASRARWEKSAHGEMLRRIIPPVIEPAQLPEPKSRGARLTAQFCVQCHNLAPPSMHHAAKWPTIVERMLPRMEGRGNLGKVMKDLMVEVQAPNPHESRRIIAYLQKHAQKQVDTAALPEAGKTPAWNTYVQACSQCHIAPDPKRHRRADWPQVVTRMESNMAWMNRVVSSRANPAEPQYRSEEIIAYLQRHARK